jgi:glutamine synthetase
MPGSAVSVANANIVLNTAVAEEIAKIYAKLEGTTGDALKEKVMEVLKEVLSAHKKVLFNGNGYTEEWVAEAERRGLPNLKSLPDAMPYWISDESIELFTKHGIFTKEEILSRYDILLENYSKSIHIESLTMQEMVRKDLTEGIIAYEKDLTKEVIQKKSVLEGTACELECGLLKTLDDASAGISGALKKLYEDTKKAEGMEDLLGQASFYQETILKDMDELRKYADEAEAVIPDEYLSYPTYGQMLFSLR